jgi:hypothetical protein
MLNTTLRKDRKEIKNHRLQLQKISNTFRFYLHNEKNVRNRQNENDTLN